MRAIPKREKLNLGPAHHVSKDSLIDALVREIRDKILSGELKDGDVLPSQNELARTLGVSRASLREALTRLRAMGLIDARQGMGTFVRTSGPAELANSLSALLIIDRVSAIEMLEGRLYVESALAGLAAQNATKDDVDALRSALEQMEGAIAAGQHASFVAEDLRFHLLVAEASRSVVLTKMLEALGDMLRQFIYQTTVNAPMSAVISAGHHRQVLAAIERQDATAARERMEEHIRDLIGLTVGAKYRNC